MSLVACRQHPMIDSATLERDLSGSRAGDIEQVNDQAREVAADRSLLDPDRHEEVLLVRKLLQNGDEVFEPATTQLSSREPEQSAGGRIDVDERPRIVDDQHGVTGGREERLGLFLGGHLT